jgi:gag-polypeptide of LTR copia-type
MTSLEKSLVDTPPFRLTDENWPLWSRKMKHLLVLKGFWDATNNRPTSSTKAQAEMLLRVSDHFVVTVDEATNASEAWEALKKIFESKGAARRVSLRLELNNIRLQSAESLAAYVARGQDLKNGLEAAGETVRDYEVVEALLMGLPQEYGVIRQILTNTDTTSMTFSELLSKLQATEASLKASGDPTVLVAKGNIKRCYCCGKKGHLARNCKDRKTKDDRDGVAM